MCMGGGGGGNGTTKYEWNDDLGGRWRNEIARGEELATGTYQPYQGERIAPINNAQRAAMNNITNFAQAGSTVVGESATDMMDRTIRDVYLAGDQRNPYGVNQPNPYEGLANSYSDPQNPYFQNYMRGGMEDIADSYNRGTRAETDRMFNLSGAFGGGAYQNQVRANEEGLAKQLQQYSSGMLNSQYDRSAGLEENRLARGANLTEGRLGRGYGAYEGERGRQVGLVPSAQNEQGLYLALQQAGLGVGDMDRGYSQDQLNMDYGNWQEEQNWPFKMRDWYSGLLSRAQGGMSPNMTSTGPNYQASPFSQLLGGGLMAYGLS